MDLSRQSRWEQGKLGEKDARSVRALSCNGDNQSIEFVRLQRGEIRRIDRPNIYPLQRHHQSHGGNLGIVPHLS